MGYSVYKVGHRWGGYGVPTICEFPSCKKKIDRGMSYACGEEPFSEVGCDRYFCSKHLNYVGFKCDGSADKCDHEEDCDCTFAEVCDMCENGGSPFPYKPEHPTWIRHLLKDKSWEEWRKENPDEVKAFKLQIKKLEKKEYE